MTELRHALVRFLEANGPSLAREAAAHLVEEHGLSAEAARQRIRRSAHPVAKVPGLSLPRGERILFHEDWSGQDRYRVGLIRALRRSGSAYGSALSGIEARGGVLPVGHFPIVSGCPERLKKHLGYEAVLEHLVDAKLVALTDTPSEDQRLLVLGHSSAEYDSAALRARLVTEDLLVDAALDWLRKLGLVSFGAARSRTTKEGSPFGQFRWDITGPSYVHPIVEHNNSGRNPGFVVVDVLLHNQLSCEHVDFFVRKTDAMRSIRNTRPFLAVLIGGFFTKDALHLGRKRGLILTTPANLLGTQVAEGLATLMDTLTRAAQAVSDDPEIVGRLFSSLGSVEGAAGNLRGPLLELIVAYCVARTEGGLVDVGKTVSSDLGPAEIDVLLTKPGQRVVAFECRGKLATSTASVDEVEEWLERKIPRIHGWIRSTQQFDGCSVGFEFWTTGALSRDAEQTLKSASARVRRYSIGWRQGADVAEYARAVGATAMVKVLEEHYLKHPLSRT